MRTQNFYLVKKNRSIVKKYRTLSGARSGVNSLYNNGMVLPDDDVFVEFNGYRM